MEPIMPQDLKWSNHMPGMKRATFDGHSIVTAGDGIYEVKAAGEEPVKLNLAQFIDFLNN